MTSGRSQISMFGGVVVTGYQVLARTPCGWSSINFLDTISTTFGENCVINLMAARLHNFVIRKLLKAGFRNVFVLVLAILHLVNDLTCFSNCIIIIIRRIGTSQVVP